MDIWLSKERLETGPLLESTGIELVSDLLEIVEAFQRDGQPPPCSVLRLLANVPRSCGRLEDRAVLRLLALARSSPLEMHGLAVLSGLISYLDSR
jgi:hypothetical protein